MHQTRMTFRTWNRSCLISTDEADHSVLRWSVLKLCIVLTICTRPPNQKKRHQWIESVGVLVFLMFPVSTVLKEIKTYLLAVSW